MLEFQGRTKIAGNAPSWDWWPESLLEEPKIGGTVHCLYIAVQLEPLSYCFCHFSPVSHIFGGPGNLLEIMGKMQTTLFGSIFIFIRDPDVQSVPMRSRSEYFQAINSSRARSLRPSTKDSI